jgi:hypothetical protein
MLKILILTITTIILTSCARPPVETDPTARAIVATVQAGGTVSAIHASETLRAVEIAAYIAAATPTAEQLARRAAADADANIYGRSSDVRSVASANDLPGILALNMIETAIKGAIPLIIAITACMFTYNAATAGIRAILRRNAATIAQKRAETRRRQPRPRPQPRRKPGPVITEIKNAQRERERGQGWRYALESFLMLGDALGSYDRRTMTEGVMSQKDWRTMKALSIKCGLLQQPNRSSPSTRTPLSVNEIITIPHPTGQEAPESALWRIEANQTNQTNGNHQKKHSEERGR